MMNGVLWKISAYLNKYLESSHELSYSALAGGMGIVYSLYHFAADSSMKIDVDKYLDRVLKSLKSEPIIYSYCNGLSGMGVLLNNLEKEDYIIGAAVSLNSFDNLILDWFKESLRIHNIDPLHGALGCLLYFESRVVQRPQLCKQVLHLWLRYLRRNIEITEKGMSIGFRTFNNPSPYNLSLSHGLSGLIIITLRILQKVEIEIDNDIKEMLFQFGCFLSRNLYVETNLISTTPSFYSPKISFFPSRLAWCYGDLGVALALFKLGSYLEKKSFIEKARKIVLHSSRRHDDDETLIRDRCICHGSCGLYIIYKFLNENLFDGELSDTVKYWFDYTYKDVFNNADSIIEKFSYYENDEQQYIIKYGILEGLAGIGLGLLNNLDPLYDLLYIR